MFAGRACYLDLGGDNRAKLIFTTMGHADHYEALKVTVLNRMDGEVDALVFRFGDIWGAKPVRNPNFPSGVKPHIWSELIRPTLTDHHGVAVFSTTPRGRNWYFDLVEAVSSTVGLDAVLGGDLPNLTSGKILEVAGSFGFNFKIGIDLDDPTQVFLFNPDGGLDVDLSIIGDGENGSAKNSS